MKSHTVGAHLESLAGCFVGCEQIVTWLKSWPGGCRRADIWFKVKMDNSDRYFRYFASHFLSKVCRCRANIHKYYQFDPRTSRARVVHLHFFCVCVCVFKYMRVCVFKWALSTCTTSVYGWALKAPRAALDAALAAALAAAVWTVLLDMTPVANSCWAFSKLAPVVR